MEPSVNASNSIKPDREGEEREKLEAATDIFNHHITLVQCNVIVNIIYLITNYNQFYSNLHPSRLTYFCGVSQRDLSRADIYKTRKSKLSLFKHLFVAETTPSEYIDLLDRRLSQSSSALFSVTFVDNGASSS